MNKTFAIRRRRVLVACARALVLAAIAPVVASCSSVPVQHFDGATPRFDPIEYFTGSNRSWGVIQARDGAPTSRFRAELNGRREGDMLVLVQDFTFEDGRHQRRTWHLKQIDAHRFDATADDVVGVATGYAYGNAFRWDYTLQLGSSAISRVQMHHWMYLAGDGTTLLNQVAIRKFGVRVGGTTEYFQHAPAPAPSIAPADGRADRRARGG